MRASSTLRHMAKAGAAGADLVRRPAPGVVVLIYHRVGAGTGIQVDLSVERFDEQVAELADAGRIVALDVALDIVAGRTAAPCRWPVVITFDDGTADFADHAVPILARHGAPATLYAATAFIDEQRSFPDDGTPLSWAALRDATSTGLVSVGSHTHRHLLLDRAPADQVADELDRSIDLIGEHLGVAPLDFAYPKAVPGSTAADQAVRARFRSAAVAGTRANRPGATDPHLLFRSPVQVADAMVWFRRKAQGGMGLEDRVRVLANQVRYAQATT